MKKPKNEEIIKVLSSTHGIIAPAARRLNVTRKTLYYWIKGSKQLQDALEQIREEQKDFAESKLLQNINNNDTKAITFYLKTMGKDRGYVEKQENEFSGSVTTISKFIEQAEKDMEKENK